MNRAATEDLRATELWPVIRRVLGGSSHAPDALTAQAADLVTTVVQRGRQQARRRLDGKIDDPGAAVMGAAWNDIADAVLCATARPAHHRPREPRGRSSGMFGGGWYGYVDKDLRTLLGDRVRDHFNLRYCGAGSRSACRAYLWAALKTAVDGLAATQGPDPTKWFGRRERASG